MKYANHLTTITLKVEKICVEFTYSIQQISVNLFAKCSPWLKCILCTIFLWYPSNWKEISFLTANIRTIHRHGADLKLSSQLTNTKHRKVYKLFLSNLCPCSNSMQSHLRAKKSAISTQCIMVNESLVDYSKCSASFFPSIVRSSLTLSLFLSSHISM